MGNYTFPDNFLWGAATSAYQIEGSTEADGRGESIWDRFCRLPGAVRDGGSGEPACDHYRRWRDDVALMRRLNLNSYRFSIAWPRVFPDGTGALNEAGIGFYDRLVDELLSHGIRPLATLYHWDLPQALQDAGGWRSRETAFRFRDYAAAVFGRLGDRVDLWVTVNEPWVASMLGHFDGRHAPGLQNAAAAVQASHHLLLGHGLAVEAFEQLGIRGAVGVALDMHAYAPASDEPGDQEAAERARTLEARWFLEALAGPGYPDDALAWYERQGVSPKIEPGDMKYIGRPRDFIGVNYYRRHVVAADPAVPVFGYRQVLGGDVPVTGLNWEVYPQGLYDVLQWTWHTYAARAGVRFLLVTENGAAYPDEVASGPGESRVRDPERIQYLESHLRQVWRAIQDGVPVQGYYAWSLMDNFEWAEGYTQRFGIVYVDFGTQRRIVKDSGRWYARAARINGLPAADAI